MIGGVSVAHSHHSTPTIRQYVPTYTSVARAAAAPPVGVLRRRCRQRSSHSAALPYIQTPMRSIAKTKSIKSVIRALLHSHAGDLVWIERMACKYIYFIDIV